MDDKVTAVYLMVRQSELKPEDNGSYGRPLAEQKEQCMRLLEARVPAEGVEPIEVYKSIRQLLMDMERERVKRLVVCSTDRLGATREDIQAMLFELRAAGIPLLTVEE